MTPKRIEGLFKSARNLPAPAVPPGFGERITRTLRQECLSNAAAWTEYLVAFWPRVAAGAAVVIALCAAAEIWSSAGQAQDLQSTLTAISEQWLFAAEAGR